MNELVYPQHYRLMETRLQERLDNGTTRCNLCAWRCRIGHGQRGFCQAHVNRNGVLYNLSYGIVSAMEIDAIEDKPVRHYRPGSRVLSVGSYGCSFRCSGCHNLDISWGVQALDGLARGQSTEAYLSPEQLIKIAKEQGVDGIAFTYSEPAVWLEYVLDVSHLAHQAGLYTVYVSNSFVTREALELMRGQVDVLCSDIKSLDEAFYRDLCRVSDVQQVLDSIHFAAQSGIHVENRTNIIPGKNDDMEMLTNIARWIHNNLGSDSPWHITRFFPAYQLAHIPATPEDILWRAHDNARRVGLTNVYVYADKGCDCAKDNAPVVDFVSGQAMEQLHAVKKCSASCCGDEGILLKRYEQAAVSATDCSVSD